jgi:hypothetical protein
MPFATCEARETYVDDGSRTVGLRSELRLLKTLERLSKISWSPTLRANAPAINARKLRLERQLEIGSNKL